MADDKTTKPTTPEENSKAKGLGSYVNGYFDNTRFNSDKEGRDRIEQQLGSEYLTGLKGYRKRMPERRKEIGKYYRGQTARYVGFSAMAVAGVAAALAPWSLPFVAAGIGVAAGGAVGVAGTRVIRDSRYNVFNDWAFASSARRWDALNRSIDVDVRRISEGRAKGLDVSHIEARVERRLERQKQSAMKAYAKNERRYQKFLNRQQKIQDGSITGRLSDLASYLGITRWSKAATRREEMFKNARHMFLSEFMEINEARAKAGFKQDAELDNMVKDYVAKTDEAIKKAEEQKLNVQRDNSKMDAISQDILDKQLQNSKKYRLEAFKKAVSDPTINEKEVYRDMKDPENIDIADAMMILLEKNFGQVGEMVETPMVSKLPLFPKVKNWATGEVELDKDGKPVIEPLTEKPKFGYPQVCIPVGPDADDVDKLVELYKDAGFNASADYQKLSVGGKPVEIVKNDDGEYFVVRSLTSAEIKNKQVYLGKEARVRVNGAFNEKCKFDFKQDFIRPIVRNGKENVPQIDKNGALILRDSYEMEPVKPFAKEEQSNRYVIKDGKLDGKYDGNLDSFKQEKDLYYMEEKASEVRRDDDKLLDASKFMELFYSNADAKQLAKFEEMLKKDKALKDTYKKQLTEAALKARESRIGVDEKETMDVYDTLGKTVGGKTYESKVTEPAKTAGASK